MKILKLFLFIFLLLSCNSNNRNSNIEEYKAHRVPELIYLNCFIDHFTNDSIGFHYVRFNTLFKTLAIFPIVTKIDTQFVFINYLKNYVCRIRRDSIWVYSGVRCGECPASYKENRLWEHVDNLVQKDSIQGIKNYFSHFKLMYSLTLTGDKSRRLRFVWCDEKFDTIVYMNVNKNEILRWYGTNAIIDKFSNKTIDFGKKIQDLDTLWYYWGTETCL